MRYLFLLGIASLLMGCNPFMLKHDRQFDRAQLEIDEAIHPRNSLEWWYFTGHLEDTTGRNYGVEYVFFHYTTSGSREHFLVNIAISDPLNEKFYYDYGFFKSKEEFIAGSLPLSLSHGSFQLQGAMGSYQLEGKMLSDNAGINLRTSAAKDPVFQNGTGYESYGNLATAGYYSYPRLTTTGDITIDGEIIPVTGELWYDRQWNCGNELLSPKVSWDWMSTQFNEKNEELMLYDIDDHRSGILLFGGSYHKETGEIVDLTDGEIKLSPLEYWTSEATGRRYPVKWQIEIGKIEADLIIEAAFPAQELVLKRMGLQLPYWEGMCYVSGTIGGDTLTGNAYLEMTNKPKVE